MSSRSVGCVSSDWGATDQQVLPGSAASLQYDQDSGELWVYVGTTRVARISTVALIPPAAPSDLTTVPAGGLCYDAATNSIYYSGNLVQIQV